MIMKVRVRHAMTVAQVLRLSAYVGADLLVLTQP
jgi:hypothetical protein